MVPRSKILSTQYPNILVHDPSILSCIRTIKAPFWVGWAGDPYAKRLLQDPWHLDKAQKIFLCFVCLSRINHIYFPSCIYPVITHLKSQTYVFTWLRNRHRVCTTHPGHSGSPSTHASSQHTLWVSWCPHGNLYLHHLTAKEGRS